MTMDVRSSPRSAVAARRAVAPAAAAGAAADAGAAPDRSPAPDSGSAPDRGALARMVMTLLDHWQLGTEQQAALLGLAGGNRAALARYRRGEPIGSSRDQYERVGHLLGIHKNLRLLFPHQRELAYRWMTTRNRAFEHRTPVEVIETWGFAGLLMVRAYLDRARGA
jgi:hypothetical protein